jgi:hypothetical protein
MFRFGFTEQKNNTCDVNFLSEERLNGIVEELWTSHFFHVWGYYSMNYKQVISSIDEMNLEQTDS